MQKWEYCRRLALVWDEMKVIAEMGEEGWELCAVWIVYLYFKRPKAA